MTDPRGIIPLPPTLALLVRSSDEYSTHRVWGAFDSLRLRAIDDLFFPNGLDGKTIFAFTAEPPHASDVECVSIPAQVFVERVYFQICEPELLVLNAPSISANAAVPQQGLSFSVPEDVGLIQTIARRDMPLVLGSLATGSRQRENPVAGAYAALIRGSLFESFYLGRTARQLGDSEAARAWFCELFAYSFFGSPEDALALYDEHPERGGADAYTQMLAGRFRLLLKQFNEARTILHTLSFHETLGAVALCELARSHLVERDFVRAIDLATTAIERNPAYGESYLIRGMAHRGISYEAGDIDGLQEAFNNFERVAKQGGFAAAEASYHAGTVCARLGALSQSELAFRQSLFQRDRVSAREALIRVLSAQERVHEAREELAQLARLAPRYASDISAQLSKVLDAKDQPRITASHGKRTGECSELWGSAIAESVQAARSLVAAWRIPLTSTISDCALLDDFINYFAPDGDFPATGQFSSLRVVGTSIVTRAFALILGDIFVEAGVAEWGQGCDEVVTLVSSKEGAKVPLERFVNDRILVGASGDNFSSLESLVVEMGLVSRAAVSGLPEQWWKTAGPGVTARYADESRWAQEIARSLGAEWVGGLSDLDEIDRIIDATFDPGGTLKEGVSALTEVDLDRFITGLGLFVGHIVARSVRSEWAEHDRPEGISLFNSDLGRVFPVAKVQRRVYLATAADFSSRLGSLAWAIAATAVTEGIREGRYSDSDQVRDALVSRLPRIKEFSEAELAGVVDSLLIGASLKEA